LIAGYFVENVSDITAIACGKFLLQAISVSEILIDAFTEG
jgi:hypothetical protein